jgi:two-component system chemotaxis response regulator CheY
MVEANAKRSCLVVDDSATIRRVIAGLFREFGFEVAEAQDGQRAVEHCRKSTPDLVMLDWNMPVMDGITCLRALRAAKLPSRPTVVMCTTENQMGKIQQALSAGADEYIMKPFDKDVLLDKLTQLGFA